MSHKKDSFGQIKTIAVLISCVAAVYMLTIVGKAIGPVRKSEQSVAVHQPTNIMPTDRIESSANSGCESITESVVKDVENPWYLTLVNDRHPLQENFSPDVRNVDNGKYLFDSRAASQLERMLDDCRDSGLHPVICSAYRTIDRQEELYKQQVYKQKSKGLVGDEAMAAAATVVAYPGTSEHNLGLAVDIVSRSYQELEKAQENTDEFKWLLEHCHEYGFILRYPEDKQHITNVIYEPWHFRYVGKNAASKIMSMGICLEEYLGIK